MCTSLKKNIPYILFNIMCDHGTNLSTIRTEYLINSKKKTKNKQTKYGRVYNKYNTIYPLNLEKKFIKFKIFILQIIIVGTKRRYGILVPNSKECTQYVQSIMECFLLLSLIYEGCYKNNDTCLLSPTFIKI